MRNYQEQGSACPAHLHPGDATSAAISFIERYSKEGLANIARKRYISTPSKALNQMLDGGIYTQEVTEIKGENHMHNGEFVIHLLVHQLYHESNSEAVIITSNGAQNEDVIYRIAHRYIETRRNNNNPQDYINVDEVAFDILRRIYIVYCVELSDLAAILEEISNNRYKRIPPWNSSLGNSQDYPAKSQNGEGRGSSCTLSQHDPNIKNHSSAFDKRPNAEIRTLIIHHMASIMEDSHNRASWDNVPTVCSKLRSIAVRMNVAVIVSNCYKDIASTTSVSEDKDEVETKIGRILKWLASSTRWNTTVDKRIDFMCTQYLKNKGHMLFTAQLTKSKHSPVPKMCHLAICERGIIEEHLYE